MPWFISCSWHAGDSRWWGSLTMTLAGNKAKRLSSINHTTKTIHHHHCQAQHVSDTLQLSQRQTSLKRHILAKNLFRRHVFCKVFHTKPLLAEIWSKYKQLCCSFIRFLNLDNRYFSLTTSLFSDWNICLNFWLFLLRARCWISIDWLIFEVEQLWLVPWKIFEMLLTACNH